MTTSFPLRSLGRTGALLAILQFLSGATPAAPIVPPFASLRDALSQPQSQFFWLARTGGKFQTGDPHSRFDASRDAGEITFDIGNNKALANLAPNGTLKTLTIYRDSYRGCCSPGLGWPGVWAGKDNSSYGPYSFALVLDGITNHLDQVDWDYRTGLLDNIFPVTELHDPQRRFVVRLLAFAPISADGTQRPRGMVYGLYLENLSPHALRGSIQLPRPFQNPADHFVGDRPRQTWAQFDPYDFEIGLGDTNAFAPAVAFDLPPGEHVWVPAILYQPAEPTVAEINACGTLAWLRDTWTYYRHLLGRVATPAQPWLAEFYEREVLEAFHAIAMSGRGKLAGSNWGSYPATRQIWMKDCFYTCLPLTALDPALAQNIILWFDEFGVRQKGELVAGGINHSISLTVASILLASSYYDQTGDRRFFTGHPALQASWGQLLDQLAASRPDENTWLFSTRYISDGPLDCDWHCGSNVAVWRAMSGYARLLAEVYHDPRRAHIYAARADKIRAAILAKTVIPGPFGPQFIEGVNRDGKIPRLTSDGEESDTTLMPFYGFLPYDDATYLNYMKFSLSTNSAQYSAATHSINWGADCPSTAPGYNKGLCAGLDRAALFGEHGYYTEIRRVTELDGSVWWWPVTLTKTGQINFRRYPGKAGWFAGVHTEVFISRFLGVRFDAPNQALTVQPLAALENYSAQDLRFGDRRFSVQFARSAPASRVIIENPNPHAITVFVTLPVPAATSAAPAKLSLNGRPSNSFAAVRYLDCDCLRLTNSLAAGQRLEIVVAK